MSFVPMCMPSYTVLAVPATRLQLACMIPLAPLAGPPPKEVLPITKIYDTMQEEVREKILIRDSEQLMHSVMKFVFS
jgi:hypothetical protein